MYNAYFNFNKRPFASVPQIDQYFPGAAIESARQTLARCIQRGEGAAMVVGPSGTGKTLLCQVLAEQFRDSLQVALLSSGRLSTRRNLFQAILYELGQPYRGLDEGETRLALTDYLIGDEDSRQGLVLLVDEAHTLPLRLLEEIRMLTNLARDGQPRVRLVLAGSGVLEERFASPKLDSFSQRLVARCYLESFDRGETQNYIHMQIDSAGGKGEAIFSEDTCQRVYQATDGVPRLINQVCDHSLVLAYVGGQHQVEPGQIEEAWADLQQLPTPWNGESQDESRGNVIEFGHLDDPPTDAEEPAEEDSGLPPLRISPQTDQPDSRAGEPAAQLERIEKMLSDAEEEFRPAGSIGPEVELVFVEPEQLLREEFADEEIVTDPYHPPEKTPDEPGPRAAEPREHRAAESAESDDHLPVEAAEEEDEDTVIVEDDYDDTAAVTCPIVPVRRQEYGQLFARLRRG